MAKALRPARCYHWDSPAYTRVAKNPSDSFITGIPGSKIIHFDMGNTKEKFEREVFILAKDNIQMRHNALEAARVAVTKILNKKLGSANYHFKIRVYPHHVMRNNIGATGAGADRVSDGMRKAFGKPIGTAARVKKGTKVFSVFVHPQEDALYWAKFALRRAVHKLPGDLKIGIESVSEESS